MPTWQEHIILGNGLLKNIYGGTSTAHAVVSAVAVPPVEASGGEKATFLFVRPEVDARIALTPQVSTLGLYSAMLSADQEYAFPLHPSVATLYILANAGTAGKVHFKWIVGR